MSAHPYRDDLGVYVLGVLPDDEALAMEEHLATCLECRSELEVLSGLPALLDTVAPEHVSGPPPTPGPEFLDRVMRALVAERADRRRRRLRRGAMVSLGAAALAASLAGVLVLRPDSPAKPARPTSVILVQDPASGVGAKVSVRSVAWGSAVHLQLWGIKAGDRCSLVAVARDGQRDTAATWAVPPGGYGGGHGSLNIDGGVAIKSADLDRWEVNAEDGRRLLTLDAAMAKPAPAG